MVPKRFQNDTPVDLVSSKNGPRAGALSSQSLAEQIQDARRSSAAAPPATRAAAAAPAATPATAASADWQHQQLQQ